MTDTISMMPCRQRSARRAGRRWRGDGPLASDTTFRPSRILASLESRGLVRHDTTGGGRTARLTEAGRALSVAARAELRDDEKGAGQAGKWTATT